MKNTTLICFLSISLLSVLPVLIQAEELGTIDSNKLIRTLTSKVLSQPEERAKALVEEIKVICANRKCTPAQVNQMTLQTVNEIGESNPLIADFLTALVSYGVSPDEVTLAAITNNIDATIASAATAAGGSIQTTRSPSTFRLPNRATPSGSGGSGGDSGISETEI